MNHPLEAFLDQQLQQLTAQGVRKSEERVISGYEEATAQHGPRLRLKDHGQRLFLAMNSNSYLDLHRHPAVLAASEAAGKFYGAGPGAVRFISGTYQPHLTLESRLAAFHQRPAAILFNSAYNAVISTLAALISPDTVVLSDQLNHNSIINGIKLAHPLNKEVYGHLDMDELAAQIKNSIGKARRLLVVSDGIFSMRGDHAPLAEMVALCHELQHHFPEGIITIIDDSHGVAACGNHGRGTEELEGAQADILIATLGKGFGVEGGYVVGSPTLISYLREKAVGYIYSNPITPAEAAAAACSVILVDSPEGQKRLAKVARLAAQFDQGLQQRGWQTISSPHPIVPLLIGDSTRTSQLNQRLFAAGILATGLNYPVVPKGAEEIRFQVTASHKPADLDKVLDVVGQA